MTLAIIALFLAINIVGLCALYARMHHLERSVNGLAHAMNHRTDIQEMAAKALAAVAPSLLAMILGRNVGQTTPGSE